MIPLALIVPVPGAGPAVLKLPQPASQPQPQPLTLDALNAASEAGAIEYASWTSHLLLLRR